MDAVSTGPPAWVTDIFKEIDAKTFGASFDVFSSSTRFQFGTGDWHGRGDVVSNLKKFDDGLDTEHTILNYWDAGSVLFFTGTVKMTFHDKRPSVTPVMSHVIILDKQDATKIVHWIAAVGPTTV